jgi:methionine-S-sulfoxide reductase
VIRTRVGYAGGDSPDPTYRNIGDHTETLQVDFDPQKVSYQDLLRVFWSEHDPFMRPFSRQYMSLIFYHNDDQKEQILKSIGVLEDSVGRKVITEVLPYRTFYIAEDYHQKYRLKMFRDIMKDFSLHFETHGELTDSTAAARLNGYVSGEGDLVQLEREIDLLGLSPSAADKLRKLVSASSM